jgi:hypothetical protein
MYTNLAKFYPRSHDRPPANTPVGTTVASRSALRLGILHVVTRRVLSVVAIQHGAVFGFFLHYNTPAVLDFPTFLSVGFYSPRYVRWDDFRPLGPP